MPRCVFALHAHVRQMSRHCQSFEVALVDTDWKGWTCVGSAAHAAAEASNSLASSAVDGSAQAPHHAVFRQFKPWQGTLGSDAVLVDFLNFTIPRVRYCNPAYRDQNRTQAIRTRQCDLYRALHESATLQVQTRWPVVAEEYIEYVDVLSAASDYVAEARPFAGGLAHAMS